MAKRRCKPSLTRCPLRGRNCCRPRNAGHNSSSDTRHGEEQTVRSSSNFYILRLRLPVLHDVQLAVHLHLLNGEPIRKLPTRGFRYPTSPVFELVSETSTHPSKLTNLDAALCGIKV